MGKMCWSGEVRGNGLVLCFIVKNKLKIIWETERGRGEIYLKRTVNRSYNTVFETAASSMRKVLT